VLATCVDQQFCLQRSRDIQLPAAGTSGSGRGPPVALDHGGNVVRTSNLRPVGMLSARSSGNRSTNSYQDARADKAGD
jgi:hypothetical protein